MLDRSCLLHLRSDAYDRSMPTDSIRSPARMSFLQFCKEWGRRTWSGRFKRAKEIQGVGALVCGFIALLVKARWPEMSTATTVLTWLPFALFAAVFLAALLCGFATAPFEIYSEEAAKTETANARISEMDDASKPKLKFISAAEGLAMQTFPNDGVRRHRLALTNLSTTARMEHVTVTAVSWLNTETNERKHIYVKLSDASGKTELPLNPGGTAHFEAALVRMMKSPPHMYLAPPHGVVGGERLTSGKYEVLIEATSSLTPPLLARYHLDLTSSGHSTLALKE